MSNTDNDLLVDENLDKVSEYFKLKGVMRTLRNDLKDSKLQKPESKELDQLNKKIKKLREGIKEDETVKELTDKLQTSKERMDLIKELIRVELLDKGQEEVKKDGRKLKLVSTLKEVKDEGDKKKDNSQYKSRNIFR